MRPEDKLSALGLELPEAPSPLGSYVAAKQSGNLLFLSGMLPLVGGKLGREGLVGVDLTEAEAAEEATLAALNGLAVLKAKVGELSNVRGCVKITGYIASGPNFIGQPAVLNAVSDLIFKVFGEAGKHARVAVGVPILPLNAPIEVEFIFELSD